MSRILVVLRIGLLAIGCSVDPRVASPGVASPGVASPAVTPAGPTATATAPSLSTAPPPTPRPTSSVTPTRTPTLGPTCPPSSVLTVRELIETDPACLGGSDVAIRAWADTPFATGWEAPFIEPAWLAYPPDGISMLWGVPPTGEEHWCSPDIDPDCASIFVYLRPTSGLTLGDQPGWVIVHGHIADPAADTCHYVVGPDWPGDPPDDESARTECRGHFVLTGVSPSPG